MMIAEGSFSIANKAWGKELKGSSWEPAPWEF